MSLRLDGISRHVGGVPYIDNVSLMLERGSLNVLLGPTLSGKTTLMRLMAGLDSPTSGRLWMDGRDVTGLHVRERSVSMVYQQFINYPALSVYENIASPLRVAKRPKEEIDQRVREAARLLKLENLLDRQPQQISGGQQQRTAIARALVKDADLVLLDEPLANLDYKLREELREELPRIFAASGAIFVYATTEPTEALLLGGDTATLCEGRLSQFGRTPQVYRQPANLDSARVFSDPPLNVLPARVSGSTVRLATGAEMPASGLLHGLGDGDYLLGLRAEQLTLHKAGHKRNGPGDAMILPARVAVSEITGSESFVHVDLQGPQPQPDGTDHIVARWVAVTPGVWELEPGEMVAASINPGNLFVFTPDGRLAAAPQH